MVPTAVPFSIQTFPNERFAIGTETLSPVNKAYPNLRDLNVISLVDGVNSRVPELLEGSIGTCTTENARM